MGGREDPCVRGEGGGRVAEETGGEWVVEGGGGGSGLHSSNGMREPLSNRCRGGARSPRWLLRTLMSFSLAPLFPPVAPVAPVAPIPSRPVPSRTRPASHPLDGPRVVLLHLRCSARYPPSLPSPSLFLLTSSPLFRGFSRRPPSFSRFPSFRSLCHRERRPWHVSIYRRRPIDTDGPRLLSRRSSASSFALLPTTATLSLPILLTVTLLTPPFTLYSSLATEHEPSTNTVR